MLYYFRAYMINNIFYISLLLFLYILNYLPRIFPMFWGLYPKLFIILIFVCINTLLFVSITPFNYIQLLWCKISFLMFAWNNFLTVFVSPIYASLYIIKILKMLNSRIIFISQSCQIGASCNRWTVWYIILMPFYGKKIHTVLHDSIDG